MSQQAAFLHLSSAKLTFSIFMDTSVTLQIAIIPEFLLADLTNILVEFQSLLFHLRLMLNFHVLPEIRMIPCLELAKCAFLYC
jgi:hypothetical protein